MRLVFAGTPQFAAVSLRRLLHQRHEIVLVLTQPDRPAGRGLQTQTSDVKRVALESRLELLQPASLKDIALQQRLHALAADAWVVVAYGLILPGALLHAPRFGCLNIHASLLPRWRGAAPIQRAIMAGDRETGISIMRMDEGLDTGPVYRQRAVPIAPDDTAGLLHDRLAQVGADMIIDVLNQLASGGIDPVPQPAEGVTYATKIERRDTCIDWTRPALEIGDLIRALDPLPGATARLGDVTLKIWRSVRGLSQGGTPGVVLTVDAGGIEVGCAHGSVVLTELQRPGGRRLSAAEFLRGFTIRAGARFDS